MKAKIRLFLLIGTAILGSQVALAADPTAVNVTVYKSELCSSSTACTTILDNSSGVVSDLVSGSGAFGSSPIVPAGTYNKLRLTVMNQISVTGDGDGTGTSCSPGTVSFLIDSSQPATAQVIVAFATADASPAGATGWYANGSESHPLLMSNPITVLADGTTDVNVSFNTAGTLDCVGATNVLSAPTFAVTSYILPTSASAFTGGDYWIFKDRVVSPYLKAASTIASNSIDVDGDGINDWPPAGTSYFPGDVISPGLVNGTPIYQALFTSADGAAYQAQLRGNTSRTLNWGGKIRFSAPDSSGAGTITLLRNPGTLRIAPVFGQDNYSAADTSDTLTTSMGTYQIDSHNRLIIFGSGYSPLHGAISQDFKTVLVAGLEDGIGTNILVKVDPSITGAYFPNLGMWNEYAVGLDRDDTVPNNGENGDEPINMEFYTSVGVFDTTSLSGNLTMQELGVGQRISNPETTSFVSSIVNDDNWSQGLLTNLGLNYVDGAAYLSIGSNNGVATHWFASNGSLAVLSSATKYVPKNTGISTTLTGNTAYDGSTYSGEDSVTPLNYSHTTTFGFLTTLAASGTYTQSSLSGTYYLSGLWDETSGSNHSQFGASDGEITLNSDGTGELVGRNLNNLKQITPTTNSFTWSITAGCIGVNNNGTPSDSSDDTRLSFTDSASTCSGNGGHTVDVVMVTASGTNVAALIPSADGKLMSFVDPNGLNASSYAHRQLGLAVKLQ